MVKQDISLYGCPGNTSIDGVNQTDWEAGESLTAPIAVCIKPNDLFYDSMETYATEGALKAVYVDSDVSNEMVTLDQTNYAVGTQALKLTSAGAANSGTLAIRTISSRDLTGYSLVILIRGSAQTTNFQVRIGATTGLTSNYLYKNITVTTQNVYQLLVLPISGFSSSGSPVLTAVTQVGFYHTGTGTESIIIDRMYFYLAGTTKYRLYKADPANWNTLPAIGFVDVSVSTGQVVGNVVNHNLLNGFTGLVPGADVYVYTAGAVVQTKDVIPTIKQKLGTAVSGTTVSVEINPTA